MTTSLKELRLALDNLLQPDQFRDYCPNGLQVEGKAEIELLVTGVTASQALLEAAIEKGADALLVHHGYFWRGEPAVVTGIRKSRLKTLLEHELSLFAYHLPLDAHAELGNNAQLGLQLGFAVKEELDPKHKNRVGVWGTVQEPCGGAQLAARIARQLGRAPLHIEGEADRIETIGWCSGAAQDFIELAHSHGVDAYLTGEASEQTVHFARESGIHFFAAGHHATERYGVQAVGRRLADKFNLSHLFIDIDNPV